MITLLITVVMTHLLPGCLKQIWTVGHWAAASPQQDEQQPENIELPCWKHVLAASLGIFVHPGPGFGPTYSEK